MQSLLLTPVVFIIFRRPDLTARVFQTIRQAKPQQLFIIADGADNESDILLCQQSREIAESINWDCEVLINYSDENLGCRKRVSSGLDWVFDQVEEAIILEDDCLPHPSFFGYCQELLSYYRDDERVWCISGDNFQDGQIRGDGSYYFSNYNHCWGWATWRRCWQKYDYNLSNWEAFRDGRYLKGFLGSELEVQYWEGIFEKLYKFGKPNSWAYIWTFTCWQNQGLTVLPNVNLVSNIGFRSDGTNITQESKLANIAVSDIGQIHHPSFIARDRLADEYTFDHVFGGKANTILGKLGAKIFSVKRKLLYNLFQK